MSEIHSILCNRSRNCTTCSRWWFELEILVWCLPAEAHCFDNSLLSLHEDGLSNSRQIMSHVLIYFVLVGKRLRRNSLIRTKARTLAGAARVRICPNTVDGSAECAVEVADKAQTVLPRVPVDAHDGHELPDAVVGGRQRQLVRNRRDRRRVAVILDRCLGEKAVIIDLHQNYATVTISRFECKDRAEGVNVYESRCRSTRTSCQRWGWRAHTWRTARPRSRWRSRMWSCCTRCDPRSMRAPRPLRLAAPEDSPHSMAR